MNKNLCLMVLAFQQTTHIYHSISLNSSQHSHYTRYKFNDSFSGKEQKVNTTNVSFYIKSHPHTYVRCLSMRNMCPTVGKIILLIMLFLILYMLIYHFLDLSKADKHEVKVPMCFLFLRLSASFFRSISQKRLKRNV